MRIALGVTVATPALVLAALTVGVPASALPYGPDTCVQGFVWREARGGDTVCVTPDIRSAVAQQNANPGAHKAGAGSPNCASGFVWREAFDGDTICVTPGFRQQMFSANGAAASRKAANQAPARPPQPIPNNGAPPQPGAQTPGGGEMPYEDWATRDACTPRPGQLDSQARTDLCALAPSN